MKNFFVVSVMLITLLLSFSFASSTYNDVTGHWAENEIDKWSELGVIKGYEGNFRPNDSITRGELAVILDRILQYTDKSENAFIDLSEEFYTDAILKANFAQVILGDGDTVRPNDKVTRQEAVVMICRALNFSESEEENMFTDKADMANWAIGYINTLVSKKYVNGYGDTFKPLNSITRAEVVKVLNNIIAKIYNKAGEYSENIDGLVIINTPGVLLTDMKISGDVIIAEGIGDKEAYFNNVEITGTLFVKAGGENCVYTMGNTKISNVNINKRSKTPLKLVALGNSKLSNVSINQGEDVSLFGSFDKVNVKSNGNVRLLNAKETKIQIENTNWISKIEIPKQNASRINDLQIMGAGNIKINGEIDNLYLNGETESLIIDDEGIVDNLELKSKVVVDNNGKIKDCSALVDGVVIGGNEPISIKIGTDVTVKPINDEGIQLVDIIAIENNNSIRNNKKEKWTSENYNLKDCVEECDESSKFILIASSPVLKNDYDKIAIGEGENKVEYKKGEIYRSVYNEISHFSDQVIWSIGVNKGYINLYIFLPVVLEHVNEEGKLLVDLGSDGTVDIVSEFSIQRQEIKIDVEKISKNDVSEDEKKDDYINEVSYDPIQNSVIQKTNHRNGGIKIPLNLADGSKVFIKSEYMVNGVANVIWQIEEVKDGSINYYTIPRCDEYLNVYETGNFDIKVSIMCVSDDCETLGVLSQQLNFNINKISKYSEMDLSEILKEKIAKLMEYYNNKELYEKLSEQDIIDLFYVETSDYPPLTYYSTKIGEQDFKFFHDSDRGRDRWETVLINMGNYNVELEPIIIVPYDFNRIAIPVLLAETIFKEDGKGVVEIDLFADGTVEQTLIVSEIIDANLEIEFSSAKELSENELNRVEFSDNVVTQDNYGDGKIGLVCGSSSDEEEKPVFIKEMQYDKNKKLIKLTYGLQQTVKEETKTEYIEYYISDYKKCGYSIEEIGTLNIKSKFVILDKGIGSVELNINKKSSDMEQNVASNWKEKIRDFDELCGKVKPIEETIDKCLYFKVASNLVTNQDIIRIGSLQFRKDEKVTINLDNVRSVEINAWKIEKENEEDKEFDLYVALPILSFEASKNGKVELLINGKTIVLEVGEHENKLSIVSSCVDDVVNEIKEGIVEQTIGDTEKSFGLLLKNNDECITTYYSYAFVKLEYTDKDKKACRTEYGITKIISDDTNKTVELRADKLYTLEEGTQYITYNIGMLGVGNSSVYLEISKLPQ